MNAFLLVVLLSVGQTSGQSAERVASAPGPDEVEIAELLHPFFLDQAASYKFSRGANAAQPLVLVREPVMSWVGDDSWLGDVFVWTYQGRPELIGCVGSWRVNAAQRGIFHEFHSLATQPLSEVRIGTSHSWASTEPGVTLKVIPGAPPPAATQLMRSIQLRRLAREFSATLKSETGIQALRMQSPLIRYGEESQQDGAVFPFVWTVGTDPEMLLILESRKTDTGQRWFFGAARFTWREQWMQYKEQQVWHARQYQEAKQTKQLKGPYTTLRVENVSIARLRADFGKRAASPEATK